MRSRALPLLFASLGALCACGPIGATSVISDAQIATARAHAAEGDKYAIYETTSADLYLQKAREDQGAALYGEAMDLAHKSLDFAEAAVKRAAEAKKAPAPPPLPPATIERPATPIVPQAPQGGAPAAPAQVILPRPAAKEPIEIDPPPPVMMPPPPAAPPPPEKK